MIFHNPASGSGATRQSAMAVRNNTDPSGQKIMTRTTKPPSGDAKKDNYEIGYGKPPKASRFKKGQSGNPKGRKKGSRNPETIFNELLGLEIALRENGQTRMIPIREALARRVVESGLKGTVRDAKAVYQLLEEIAPNALRPEDHEIEEAVKKSKPRGRPRLIYPGLEPPKPPALAPDGTDDLPDWDDMGDPT
jgi:hypothetical protein